MIRKTAARGHCEKPQKRGTHVIVTTDFRFIHDSVIGRQDFLLIFLLLQIVPRAEAPPKLSWERSQKFNDPNTLTYAFQTS